MSESGGNPWPEARAANARQKVLNQAAELVVGHALAELEHLSDELVHLWAWALLERLKDEPDLIDLTLYLQIRGAMETIRNAHAYRREKVRASQKRARGTAS